MYQLFESIKIALAAIWANKLRSFLTVLGNIVAVTSIIAVVSLVQGIDDYVSDAIVSDLGVGTFSVQRFGMITERGGVREGRRQPADHRARRHCGQDRGSRQGGDERSRTRAPRSATRTG